VNNNKKTILRVTEIDDANIDLEMEDLKIIYQ